MGLDGETGYDPVFSQDMPLPKEKGKVHVEGHRCPYCHDQVVKGEGEAQLCDQCFAVSHRDCWTEHDGCGACGAGAQICGVCGGKFNKDEAITTVISCMSCPQEFHLDCADQHECEQEEGQGKRQKFCHTCSSQLRFSSSACKKCSEQFCKDCFYEHACEQEVELKPGHCPVCRRHMLVSVDCPRCERAHHDGCLSGHKCVPKKKRVAERESDEIASMPSGHGLPSGEGLDGELEAANERWKKVTSKLMKYRRYSHQGDLILVVSILGSLLVVLIGKFLMLEVYSQVVAKLLFGVGFMSLPVTFFCSWKEKKFAKEWDDLELYVNRLKNKKEEGSKSTRVVDAEEEAHSQSRKERA